MSAPVILIGYDVDDIEAMARAFGYDLDDVSVNEPGDDLTPVATAAVNATIEVSLAARARPDYELVDRAVTIHAERARRFYDYEAALRGLHRTNVDHLLQARGRETRYGTAPRYDSPRQAAMAAFELFRLPVPRKPSIGTRRRHRAGVRR